LSSKTPNAPHNTPNLAGSLGGKNGWATEDPFTIEPSPFARLFVCLCHRILPIVAALMQIYCLPSAFCAAFQIKRDPKTDLVL